jgi:two-component system chemotaxis sensor kinase CheA
VGNDPYKYFRIEARELCARLLCEIPELSSTSDPGALSSRLFRVAHTLKGAATVVKQARMAELAHALEDGLTTYRDGRISEPGQPEKLLMLVRQIEQLLDHTLPATDAQGSAGNLAESLTSARIEIAELDTLIGEIEETRVQLTNVRRIISHVEHAGRLADLLVSRLAPPRGKERAKQTQLDEASSLAHELGALLPRLKTGLSAAVDQVERELRQVHDKAEHVRLLPASALLEPLTRAAHESARALGKQVRVETHGESIRLSTEVLAAVQPAMLQLTRNALAHGIELPGQRRTKGKAVAGRLQLSLQRRGHFIAFACEDDGAGIDGARVKAAAQRQGLTDLSAHELGSQELLRLLLHERITTSATVTNAAGRGVGLDVVREVAERMGGHVAMTTQPGAGARFELVVPVSLTAIDALLVEASGTIAAIPLDAVQRTLDMRAGDVAQTQQGLSVLLEDHAIPFARLRDALQRSETESEVAGEGPTESLVVICVGARSAAIGVDRLLGTTKLVVRPLPHLAPASKLIGGVAIDAMGSPRLVLDVEELIGYPTDSGLTRPP